MVARVLVVPSNREECFRQFLTAWEGRGGWDEILLIEDNPTRTFKNLPIVSDFVTHVSHEEIVADLGADSWIISKKDSACLCYGFLLAWRKGATHVLTLSDDCFPTLGYTQVFDGHLAAMRGHRRWISTVPSATRWPSSSLLGFRVRGLPYENLGHMETVINVGLWCGVPDLDGKTQLEHPITNFVPPPGSRLIPAGQYAPICEMSLMVARQAIPLIYMPLMGEGQPYRRFDDIWMGIIAKKICDHLGWPVSCGEPFIRHERASDPQVNFVKEAPGVAVNEYFWRIVDAIPLMETSALGCMSEVGNHLRYIVGGENLAGLATYLRRLGQAILIWVRLFRESS